MFSRFCPDRHHFIGRRRRALSPECRFVSLVRKHCINKDRTQLLRLMDPFGIVAVFKRNVRPPSAHGARTF